MKWMMAGCTIPSPTFAQELSLTASTTTARLPSVSFMPFSENFMLPSHDEVVYGKHPPIYKMSGDEWQKFANLRTMYGYMYGHPAPSCSLWAPSSARLRMGATKAPSTAPAAARYHQGVQRFIRDLNRLYRTETASTSFSLTMLALEWADPSDWENSVIGLRERQSPDEVILVVCNLTPFLGRLPHGGIQKKGTGKNTTSCPRIRGQW